MLNDLPPSRTKKVVLHRLQATPAVDNSFWQFPTAGNWKSAHFLVRPQTHDKANTSLPLRDQPALAASPRSARLVADRRTCSKSSYTSLPRIISSILARSAIQRIHLSRAIFMNSS